MPSRMRELIAENVQVGQHARHYQVGAAANP
jgi:hypothetical protein